ncbi:hypothetical protein ACK3SF_00420 [Candidatus Nanosalina sp. VS9-1]|uniref:COG1470 family protein n=1 Tax=Candidatus Nanosalina sp. VS9-1 TaxID=3388566 RepID=UPI0039E00737
MRFDKLVVATFLIVMATGVATASTAELDIFPKESSTMVDSFTSYELKVTNTGTTEDRYHLSSTHSSEIEIAPRQIPETGNLEPGESETAQIWFNPDLDREEGRYDFTLTATSQASQEDYRVSGTVEVIREHDVNLEVESPGSVCRGEEAKYTVFVTNGGTQAETFRLTSEGGQLSQNRVTVDSGSTETVGLTRSSDIAVTDRAFTIEASSTSSYADDAVSTSFIVESCYETDTTISPQNQRAAAFTEVSYDVTVTNEGTRSVNVPLSTNYGELEDSELSIASGDSKTTELTYTPEELGTQTLEVEVGGEAPSSASASLEVYNGQDVSVEYSSSTQDVCEAQQFEKRVTLENTGEASDTYDVSVNRGNLSESEVQLDPGEERRLEIGFDSSEYEVGESYEVETTVQSQTFDEPEKTATSTFTVENCYDLEMDVIPNIQSAGENRSVLYEIHLENTGTAQNTYSVSAEGPDWISVRPTQVTVLPGETEKSYIYAGIPYNQTDGTLEITATAEGEMVEKSETVELVIGEEVRDSIESPEGGSLTGKFFSSISGLFGSLTAAGNGTKLLISLLAGLLISAAILYREW